MNMVVWNKSKYGKSFDLEIKVGQGYHYFMVHRFALYLDDNLIYEAVLGSYVSVIRCLTAKLKEGLTVRVVHIHFHEPNYLG